MAVSVQERPAQNPSEGAEEPLEIGHEPVHRRTDHGIDGERELGRRRGQPGNLGGQSHCTEHDQANRRPQLPIDRGQEGGRADELRRRHPQGHDPVSCSLAKARTRTSRVTWPIKWPSPIIDAEWLRAPDNCAAADHRAPCLQIRRSRGSSSPASGSMIGPHGQHPSPGPRPW